MKPKIIEEFERGTLPKPQWTHEAHLMVGLWYVFNAGFDDALEMMRRNVRHYNECTGTPNTDNSGYHETITVFWLLIISRFVADKPALQYDELTKALLADPWASRDLFLQYYSKTLIMSVKARQIFLRPDLKPLPGF